MPKIIHQNLAVILWQSNYSKNTFKVLSLLPSNFFCSRLLKSSPSRGTNTVNHVLHKLTTTLGIDGAENTHLLLRGNITVQLTSYLTGLDSAALLMMNQ